MSALPDKPYVGGQAVLEGVMMRSPRSLAIAVRRKDGTIVLKAGPWVSIWERLRFLRWPGLRGAVILFESLYNGIQALDFAATESERDAAAEASAESQPPSKLATAATIAFSFALALGLFVGLPHAMAYGAGQLADRSVDVDTFLFHVLDGVFKIGVFVTYIVAISRIPDIRRVFEYHGAEHKVVNAYETGADMTLEAVRAQPTFHARCGTSFMLFVLVLSIFMFAAVFPFVPRVSDITWLNHVAMIFIKIPLMLPLAGVAYEINRYAAAHPTQLWVQAIVVPGRLMQKLTTKAPDDDQLEIALSAMRAALEREAELEPLDLSARAASRSLEPAAIAVYRDYSEVAAAYSAR